MTSSRALREPGKIYLYGKYLLVNGKRQDIHVFDHTNPAEPVNLGFLPLPGNTDMAIQDGLHCRSGNRIALSPILGLRSGDRFK